MTEHIRTVSIPLTRERRDAMVDEWGKAGQKIARIKAEQKEAAGNAKTEMGRLEARMVELHAITSSGSESREIVCVERRVEQQNKIELVRSDNGDVVDELAITPNDKQGELDYGQNDEPAPETEENAGGEETAEALAFEIDDLIVAHTGPAAALVDVYGRFKGETFDGLFVLEDENGTQAEYSPDIVERWTPEAEA